jgi:serine protease DegQ
MRKFWLIFSQTVTICLAVLFVVATLRPDLLTLSNRGGGILTIQEPLTRRCRRS